MTGLMVALVVALTLIAMTCLVVTAFLIWWTMDSAGQHSISAGRQTTLALEAMKDATAQTSTVVGMVTNLSELLLLGREIPESSRPPEPERPPEIPLTPSEVWDGLPTTIQENLLREAEEAGIWPSPSEQLQNGYDEVTERTST